LRPIGGSKMIKVDFRLIAATNKDLRKLVDEGRFREDLYFRLKTFQIDLPPLRSRKEDIPELAYFFIDRYCSERRLKNKRISTEYLVILRRYGWPGNVRELFNVIERSIAAASDSDMLLPIHMPINIRVQAIDNLNKVERPAEEWRSEGGKDRGDLPTLQKAREITLNGLERKYLHDLLNSCSGNVGRACEIADVSRSRLYALLKKYNLSPSSIAKGNRDPGRHP
jgi:two-component system NtrC family response regulator